MALLERVSITMGDHPIRKGPARTKDAYEDCSGAALPVQTMHSTAIPLTHNLLGQFSNDCIADCFLQLFEVHLFDRSLDNGMNPRQSGSLSAL